MKSIHPAIATPRSLRRDVIVRPPKKEKARAERGFTLIELLVAITIFAILGVLAYGGYNTSAKQAAIARENMARFKELQTAVRLITQDFEQLAPRPVRDVLGDNQLPALMANQRDTQNIVVLTRAGWTNPAGVQRSTLQRVSYVLEKGTLRRDHWTVLDATLSNKPVQRELIKDVTSVKIRYMDGTKQWQEQWPPLALNVPIGDLNRARPIAVEIKLELKDFGEITRLIEVAR